MIATGWNINALAAFVSLGGLFFGLDTDMFFIFSPMAYSDIFSSSIRSIGPVTVMPQFLDTFPEAKNKTVQGTLVATVSSPTIAFFSLLTQINGRIRSSWPQRFLPLPPVPPQIT
jgi:hypothetical protein